MAQVCVTLLEVIYQERVKEPGFQNNYPSRQFDYHFKKRHTEIIKHFAGNIKRSRAIVKKRNSRYHLQEELDNITA